MKPPITNDAPELLTFQKSVLGFAVIAILGILLVLSYYIINIESSSSGPIWLYLFVMHDGPWLIIFPFLVVPFLLLSSDFKWLDNLRLGMECESPRSVWAWPLGGVIFTWLCVAPVYKNFTLSMDEFLVVFQAEIFLSGRVIGLVPELLRDYMGAAQHIFMTVNQELGLWLPNYRPLNALALTPFVAVGLENYAGAVFNFFAVFFTVKTVRLLWPNRNDLAVLAAILLATSPQVIITGLTTYAMNAHLCLACIWLYLVIRGGRGATTIALAVGWCAIGLHQIHLFPIFAAPFIFLMVLYWQWGRAVLHASVYLVGIYFWHNWTDFALMLGGYDRHAFSSAKMNGEIGILGIAIELIERRSAQDISDFVAHLIRLISWQHILTFLLAIYGLLYIKNMPKVVWAIGGAIIINAIVHFLLMPTQGHGWGYRYMHNLLGVITILAVFGYSKFIGIEKAFSARKIGVLRLVAFSTLATILVLLPLRLLQVESFIDPYYRANLLVGASASDVVLINSAETWYGQDLVRNSPSLSNRPLVMDAGKLGDEQIAALCTKKDILMLGAVELAPLGIIATPLEGASIREGISKKLALACTFGDG